MRKKKEKVGLKLIKFSTPCALSSCQCWATLACKGFAIRFFERVHILFSLIKEILICLVFFLLGWGPQEARQNMMMCWLEFLETSLK